MRHRIGTTTILAILTVWVHLACPTLHAQHLQIGDDIDGQAENDYFGHAVGISADGSIVAVGAPYTYVTDDLLGDVRVYRNESGTWTQIGDDIAGEEEFDEFGLSLGLSADGSVVAIGAPANSGAGTLAGQVRVFENQSGTWTQIGSDIFGEAAQDRFGTAVSLSADGSIVAVGAPHHDGTGNNAGRVRVLENQVGVWTQIGGNIEAEAADDGFGTSVSLSADGATIAIGAPHNDGAGNDAGHVRVYEFVSNTWNQVGSDIDGENLGDLSGHSVDLSSGGTVLAIGAHYATGSGLLSGHVRVFELQSGDWVQVGDDIDGEAANDFSGISVSLSAGGSIVAIGAHLNDGTAPDAGHVRIYQNQSGIWTLIDNDIDGEAAYDEFGDSVALNADGSIAAIGAPNNDEVADNAGHVRVYGLDVVIGEIFSDGFESGGTTAWL